MIRKQRKHSRTQPARQTVTFAPLRIEVTTEEILADLRYPASRRVSR